MSADEETFSFDGFEGDDAGISGKQHCTSCGEKRHDHEKERVYPDDGPTGSYHYRYICP